MSMKRYIANRFQHAGSGLSLDTEALAKYNDIIDLSPILPLTRPSLKRHTSTRRRATPTTATPRATRSSFRQSAPRGRRISRRS